MINCASTAPGCATAETMRIRASRLVIGRARQVIHNGGLVISADSIAAVEPPGEDHWQRPVREIDFGPATIVPGLLDPHVHLSISAGEDLRAHSHAPGTAIVDRIRQVSRELLTRGITTVRDLGCRSDVLASLHEGGHSESPGSEVIASGPPITSRRGHFWPIGIEIDDPRSAAAATERLVAAGAKVIKVMATGGFLTPGTNVGRAQLGLPELAAIVDAAHAHDRRVAAHAHGTEGIALAVRAGVDTVEHCSWTDPTGAVTIADPNLLDAMAQAGQSIVSAGPLCSDMLAWFHHRQFADTPPIRRQLALWENALRAHHHGVTVALGTDSMFGALPETRDLEARLTALVELAGWDRLDALQLVTGNAARVLGDPHRGIIAPNAVADIAVFPGDLTTDLSGLTTPLAVWKHGTLVASPHEHQMEPSQRRENP